MVAEPGQLPFGQAARGEQDGVHAFLAAEFPAQVGLNVPEADGHPCRRTGRGAVPDFVDGPAVKHRADVVRQDCVQIIPFAGQEQPAEAGGILVAPWLPQRGGGASGQGLDLQGADEAAGVLKIGGGPGTRIRGVEARLQFGEGERGEFRAEDGVRGGNLREAMGEGFEVEAGSSGEDGNASAGGDSGHRFLRESGEAGGVEWFGRREEADQMVRDFRLKLRGGLGGEDGEAGVDLIRVAPNNFAADLEGQLGGEKGFADPGGAGDDDGEVIAQAARTIPADPAARTGAGVRCAFPRPPWRR